MINLTELKKAAEMSIAWAEKYGNIAYDIQVDPATILKLIAVFDAADTMANKINVWATLDALRTAIKELEK